jgi:predicted transcriptional regulator
MPPSAVDVIRYLSKLDMHKASIDDICEAVGLSERGFGKAIRSLVTKGYVVMDGDQVYRLTDNGGEVAEEIAYYFDDEEGEAEVGDAAVSFTRRLVLVMPRQLAANQPAHLVVGIAPLARQSISVEMVARLSVLNGEPSTPQEAAFELDGGSSMHDFLITPGPFSQARVKVEVFQLGPNPGDIAVAGGMYVDVPISAEAGGGERIAYGTDITVEQQD